MKVSIASVLIGILLLSLIGYEIQPNSFQSNEGDHIINETTLVQAERLIQVDTNPESVTVLVNKHYKLPDEHTPEDLVYPNVPFYSGENVEWHKMRKEAADSLEKLFSAAKRDGLSLLGVSGYRSYDTQKSLFEHYVERHGEEKARTYSAVPGHSEHQTGLAIDVTGGDRTCVVAPCFAYTEEAKWLKENAANYGFIIRYLEGKEQITGYIYEPWHLRYVGIEMAKEIATLGVSLEEYMNAVPVEVESTGF
ncbi:M15 family metallopeptidase [Anaerobacillus sp. CMMVII]|uniref:M15 family metallopeptidase n=1 Tax=Anaerobacillus sp. CMMVII TaxID=2755588 RepID=UPI0021B7AE5C|nr:M15 family metallopeptidase [Anaerobacillus sp. CMMVII]MCT8140328.1 M15 family metallopeptidase [Anaerobacillus sp. CMMVII]